MALASDPVLLLMDEPTAGMSPEETTVMMRLIRELADERTVVLVEHKMKLVMGLCERLIVLHHGDAARRRHARRDPRRTPKCGASTWASTDGAARGRRTRRVVRPQPRGAGRVVRRRARRDRHVDGPQRRRQDDDAARAHGTGREARRDASCSTAWRCWTQPTHARFHRGLAYVPEERRIVRRPDGPREPAARHHRQRSTARDATRR